MDVTIIIPYNEDRGYLSEAIQSAFLQEFKGNYETIVHMGDFTVGRNLNDAIKQAKGKYIKGCAEDDLLMPNCIQDLFDFAESGNYDFVCANAINFYPDGEEILRESVISQTVSMMAEWNQIHGGTVLYKKQSLIDVGMFDEKLITGEEWDLAMRMGIAGYKFGYVNKLVFRYRMHEKMKSQQYNWDNEEAKIIRERAKRDIMLKYINNHKKITR